MGEAAQEITDAVADVIGRRAAGNWSPVGSLDHDDATNQVRRGTVQAADQHGCEARPEGFEPPTF